MPLYEFECHGCHKRFEELVSSSSDVECPKCGSRDLEKLMSAFAVGGGAATAAIDASPCGSCQDPRGPGACRMRN